eukprot:Opistho-2@46720
MPLPYRPRNILVTGGAGFIGSHVAIALVDAFADCHVVNIDKLEYCASLLNVENVADKPNYKFIQGDVCSGEFVAGVLQQEAIDTIFHFAAHTHVDNSFLSPLAFTLTNIVGTHVLISAAHTAGVRRFIYISTDEVYGGVGCEHDQSAPLSEESPLKPTNPYAASKAAAECIVMSYWKSFKFPVIVTRGSNVYGPHQYPEKIVPKFISRLLAGRAWCVRVRACACVCVRVRVCAACMCL